MSLAGRKYVSWHTNSYTLLGGVLVNQVLAVNRADVALSNPPPPPIQCASLVPPSPTQKKKGRKLGKTHHVNILIHDVVDRWGWGWGCPVKESNSGPGVRGKRELQVNIRAQMADGIQALLAWRTFLLLRRFR